MALSAQCLMMLSPNQMISEFGRIYSETPKFSDESFFESLNTKIKTGLRGNVSDEKVKEFFTEYESECLEVEKYIWKMLLEFTDPEILRLINEEDAIRKWILKLSGDSNPMRFFSKKSKKILARQIGLQMRRNLEVLLSDRSNVEIVPSDLTEE